MTEKEREIIKNYNFPKYYKWFYKFWTKYLSLFIVSMFVIILIMMVIYNQSNWDGFNIIKGFVFGVFGIGLWAFSAYLTKTIHLKKYLKKSEMTLLTWNTYTKGLTIDDLKKF